MPLALLLSFAFMIATAVQRWSDMHSMMFRGPVLESALAGPIWATKLFLNLMAFFGAIVALHALFAVACWLLAKLSRRAWPHFRASERQWLLLWTLLGIACTSFASAALFPPTTLGEHYGPIARVAVGGLPLYRILAAMTLTFLGLTLLRAAWKAIRPSSSAGAAPARAAAVSACAVLTLALVAFTGRTDASDGLGYAREADQPNVILIGIDSLRLDVLRQDASAIDLPNLRRFLAGATQFTDTVTPLARTFPSWVSLLTGRHPHTTGAFVNLLPRDSIDTGGTLADMFRDAGYRTVYAIDEVRFSNIDETYGFDVTVTPPIGATEFVLTFFADTPLLNLTVNTWFGSWLFPHLHANRGAATFYEPSAFIERIDDELPSSQPLFLAAHLTLSHWPYRWRGTPAPKRLPVAEQVPQYYRDALSRTDRQFGQLLEVLERKRLLDNAIVVVFSDHGESFGTAADSLVPIDSSEIVRIGAVPRWGHGTSVLSAHQYQALLAFRRFGIEAATPGGRRIDVPASIEDVTPTLVDLLELRARAPFDGRSLRPLLEATGPYAEWPNRIRFTETEFNPMVIASVTGRIHTSRAATVAHYYRVDPDTDRVELRREYHDWLKHMRQFAAIGPRHILAAVPSAIDGRFIYMLVPRQGGFPLRLEAPSDAERDPDAAALWDALWQRFGSILQRGPATEPVATGRAAGHEASKTDALRQRAPERLLAVRSASA